MVARQAVTYARDHLFEKSAVQDRRALYETALQRGMGEVTYSQVQQEVKDALSRVSSDRLPHRCAGRRLRPPRCCVRSGRSSTSPQEQ